MDDVTTAMGRKNIIFLFPFPLNTFNYFLLLSPSSRDGKMSLETGKGKSYPSLKQGEMILVIRQLSLTWKHSITN